MKKPLILVDTREQKPYLFEGRETRKVALDAGDYSVRGCRKLIAIERKSVLDWFNFLQDSTRLKRQCSKLVKRPFRAIVVEGNVTDFSVWVNCKPHAVALMTARIVAARIPVHFASNRHLAEVFTLSLLDNFYERIRNKGVKNAQMGKRIFA